LVDEATTAIIEQAERLHRLTRALLDLTRLDEGPALAREVVSLGQIAAHVVAELKPLAGEKTIQLTATGPTAGSTLVQGDPDELEQLVVNLVDNALKFTPPGGHVRVTAKHDATGRTPTVVLEVQDTGCGIAATDLPHIFERFYRVDRARSRAMGGTGLGLAIVHEVARCHGGTVEVESQPRQGSLFRARFPAVVADGTRA
jgi:signal transduction histidine kinase